MAIDVASYDFVGDFTQSGTTETQRIRWDAGTEFTADDTLLMLFEWTFYGHPTGDGLGATSETELDAADQGPGNDAESRFDRSERGSGTSGYLSKHGGKWFSEAVNSYVEVKTYGEGASSDSRWRNMGGLAINLTDIASDSTQYVAATTDNANAAMATSWGTDLVTCTVTPNEAGEKWLIIGHHTARVGSNALLETRLLDGADAIIQAFEFDNYLDVGLDDYTTHPVMAIWTAPDTTAEEFALQGRNGGGTINAFVAHLTAIRLDSISTNYVVHEPADYTIVSGNTEEDTGGTATLTGAGGDIVLLAMCRNESATTQDSMNIWATKDGNTNPIPTTYTTWNSDFLDGHRSDNAGSAAPVAYIGHEAAVTGARTYELYGAAENAGAVAADIRFLALELDGGDGGTSPTTNLTARDLADLSEKDMNTLATDAGVTLTQKSKLGRMRQIAGASNTKEYEGTLDAIKDLFGL